MTGAPGSPLSPDDQQRAADVALGGLDAACEYFRAVYALRLHLRNQYENDLRRREKTGEGKGPAPLGEDFHILHDRAEVGMQGVTLATSRANDLVREFPVVARDAWFSEVSGIIRRLLIESREVAKGINETLGDEEGWKGT